MYDIDHGISSRDKIIHVPAISRGHHTRVRMILEVLNFCARAKKLALKSASSSTAKIIQFDV